MNYTPGPWNIAEGIYGKSVVGPIQCGINGGTVVPCVCKLPDMPEWKENARLIAMAPELLEELIKVEKYHLPTPVLCSVRAAILKAGGKYE